MPLVVSVVVTTFNGVKYLKKQLDSILDQTWPCVIYVFDDGSTDGTVELIEENYAGCDNIFLFCNEHQLGYVKNFEKGIQYVYGIGAQYVALSDQDDIWLPKRLEKMMNLVLSCTDNKKPCLVYSDLQMIDQYDRPLQDSYFDYRGYSKRRGRHLAVALGQNGVMGNTILMSRPLVGAALPFPTFLHSHDYWISLVAQLFGRCLFVNESLVRYRIHKGNVSNSVNSLQKVIKRHKEHRRDYQLPYKEDSRRRVLECLLVQCERKKFKALGGISQEERELIEGFISYLRFSRPRWCLSFWMLRHGFIKKGLKNRLMFTYRMFVTERYLVES